MKDYELIINANDDIIKFTVKDKSKFEDYKYSVMVLALAVLVYTMSHLMIPITQQSVNEIPRIEVAKVLVLILIIVLSYSRQSQEDTMIVMKSIGIQLNYRSKWKFVTKSNKNIFIPVNNIIDLVIHEGFYGYGQVIYYMCVLTKTNPNVTDNDMIKVVFSELLPRKDLLVTVWKQSRQILFNNTQRYWRRVPGQGLKPVQ